MRVYDNNKNTYVMLSHTGSVLTRAIKFYTKTPYNHVSLVLDEQLEEIYSFGRKYPKLPFFGGFVREYKDKGTFAYFENTTCIFLKMDISEEQYDKLIENLNVFKKKKGRYYYNILGIIFVLFNIPIRLPYGYVCSHFVADVLEKSGVKLFDKKSSLVSTVDFYNLKDCHDILYEGKLSEFDNDDLAS